MPRLVIYTPGGDEIASLIGRETPELDVAVAPTDDLETARALVADAEYLLAWRIPPELLAAARRLEWVQSFGAGVDHLVGLGLPPGVTITRIVDAFSRAMAEFVVGYCYAAVLDLRRIFEQQRRRHWELFTAQPLHGRTAVVVGLGSIGQEVCALLSANGLRVLGVSRGGRPVPSAAATYPVAELDRVLPEANFLVLVAPLTPQTRGLIDARRLALLPSGAWLVNVARGPIVVEADLLAALRSGPLGGAVLDVFDREPLPVDHPFWSMPNVIVTPHMAGPDDNSLVASQFLANYRRRQVGAPLVGVVDRERGY